MIIIYSHSNSPTFNYTFEEFYFTQSNDELLYVNDSCVVIILRKLIII